MPINQGWPWQRSLLHLHILLIVYSFFLELDNVTTLICCYPLSSIKSWRKSLIWTNLLYCLYSTDFRAISLCHECEWRHVNGGDLIKMSRLPVRQLTLGLSGGLVHARHIFLHPSIDCLIKNDNATLRAVERFHIQITLRLPSRTHDTTQRQLTGKHTNNDVIREFKTKL